MTNTFRRHPRHALEKDGFYADLFSQRTYQEPHVPRRGPGNWASQDGTYMMGGSLVSGIRDPSFLKTCTNVSEEVRVP